MEFFWSALMKLPGPRAFQTVVMAVIAVVTAPFFMMIIIATRQVVRVSSPSDVVLILVIGLRKFGEIIDWSEKRCCMAE